MFTLRQDIDIIFSMTSLCILPFMLFSFLTAFIALLDNYERETGVPETVTPQEKKENWRFTDLVLKSDCMKEAYRFLKSKGKANRNFGQFKWDFYKMWFYLYRRTRGERCAYICKYLHICT